MQHFELYITTNFNEEIVIVRAKNKIKADSILKKFYGTEQRKLRKLKVNDLFPKENITLLNKDGLLG